VPLYACERCGFTSAAFRKAAALAHRFEYPDCDGVIRIIFRSEDRYRGAAYAHAAGVSQTAAPSSREGNRRRHKLAGTSRCASVRIPTEPSLSPCSATSTSPPPRASAPALPISRPLATRSVWTSDN
jgi:hypothetical protein